MPSTYAWMLLIFALAYIEVTGLIIDAPEGYEDEDGFHYGRPDDRRIRLHQNRARD
jgi:hypothetical protein